MVRERTCCFRYIFFYFLIRDILNLVYPVVQPILWFFLLATLGFQSVKRFHDSSRHIFLTGQSKRCLLLSCIIMNSDFAKHDLPILMTMSGECSLWIECNMFYFWKCTSSSIFILILFIHRFSHFLLFQTFFVMYLFQK